MAMGDQGTLHALRTYFVVRVAFVGRIIIVEYVVADPLFEGGESSIEQITTPLDCI